MLILKNIYKEVAILSEKHGENLKSKVGKELSLIWSLKELYSSFQGQDFLRDLDLLDKRIQELNHMAESNFKDTSNRVVKLEEYITKLNEYQDLFGRLMVYANLSFSANSKDGIAKSYMGIIEAKSTALTKTKVRFSKWLLGIENLKELSESSDIIKDHLFFLEETRKQAAYTLDEKEEDAIAKLRLTGSSAWANMKKLLASNHTVDIELQGKKETLGINYIKNMSFSKDGELRRKAYYAEKESNEKIAEPIAAALNAIKGEVLTLCDMKGYMSPLHKTLVDSHMDEETLETMLKVMKESLIDFQPYFSKKAEILGHKDKLPYYDIMAPVGKDMVFSYPEAAEYVIKHFYSFSEEMGDMASEAFNNSWIDAEVREGKSGGAFCSNIHGIGESRILSSFSGSFKNVCTLAHELGHAYHGHILRTEKALNAFYPMPLAETASIFSETLVRNAALQEADEEEAMAILGAELINNSQTIVDIYARFLFEKRIFEERKKGQLSLREIKELMLWAQKEAYGDAIDPDTLDEYAWIHKAHYYFPDRSFYNFPYAFGLLFAKGLYKIYLKEGDSFINKYRDILRLTGRASVYDVAKFAGINLHNEEFWRGSMEIIKKDIEKFCSIKGSNML